MEKIIPHLWFDTEAKVAAAFYTSTFSGSKITDVTAIHDTPSGSCDIVTLDIMGQEFQFISAGPLFKFNPSVSFLVAFSKAGEVDALWHKLIEGGRALMPLDSYPFSERYGWLQDKFGVSWQIMLTANAKQAITPTLMFVGPQAGRAEEAMALYTSVFANSEVEYAMRYEKGEEPDREGTLKHAGFSLDGYRMAAMDSAHGHDFAFNEAISFMAYCKNQDEIDSTWDSLSADPTAEQCGWLKDKFGLSWQVVPSVMDEMMKDKNPETLVRVTQAFLKMKKFDIATLEKAYRGD